MTKKNKENTENNLKLKWEALSVKELKFELSKLQIDVKSAKEKNTSLIKLVKRIIAKKLTLENNSKK